MLSLGGFSQVQLVGNRTEKLQRDEIYPSHGISQMETTLARWVQFAKWEFGRNLQRGGVDKSVDAQCKRLGDSRVPENMQTGIG
jgi:hypothetical protein